MSLVFQIGTFPNFDTYFWDLQRAELMLLSWDQLSAKKSKPYPDQFEQFMAG